MSDYNQFSFKKRFGVNKKQITSRKKREIQVIIFMIVHTCSSESTLNSSTGMY